MAGARLVAVVGVKGGTGKTSLAVAMSCLLGAGRRVSLLDADPQGTAARWVQRAELPIQTSRPADTGDIRGDTIRAVAAAVEDCDLLVADCRPASHEVCRTLAALADLVLIPTGPSAEEMHLAKRVLEAVQQEALVVGQQIPTLIVPTRWNSRTTLGRDALDYLPSLGVPITDPIHERVAWQEAVSEGVWLASLGSRGADALAEAEAVANAARTSLEALNA